MFSHRKSLLLVGLLMALLLSACAAPMPEDSSEGESADEGMAMDSPEDLPVVPAGRAFADGETIYFIHTEASDPEIAELLSGMMDSPVIHVPALADTPESMLADVYVFTNGPEGMGPLGFQPDVFVDVPGDEGYSPLRSIILVTWAEGVEGRELMSEAEILEAEAAGDLTLERPGVVVNMPFIQWPGGSR